MHISTLRDLSIFANKNQILGPHMTEGFRMRVDLEMVWHDRVSYSDMATSPFVVVAIIAQPA